MRYSASIGDEQIKRVDRTPVELSIPVLTGVLSTRADRCQATYKLQLSENATSATMHSDENITCLDNMSALLGYSHTEFSLDHFICEDEP